MQLKQSLTRAAALVSYVRSGSAPSATESNIRLLYWEIAWFGLLFGVTMNFLVVFVARLNANPWLVSAVTSGPALVNVLWQLQAARIVERFKDPQRLTVLVAVPQRLGFLLIALVPLCFPFAWQGYAVVAIILLQGIPTAIMFVAFSTMLTELVPRERMMGVVGTRNVLLGVTSTLVVIVAGFVLTWLPFPWGYQALFLAGFLASLASIWCVARLRVEPRPTASPADVDAAASAPAPAIWRDLNFGRFALGAGTLQLGMFMTAPLFPLYWVGSLGLSDGWISAFATTLSATSIIGAFGLQKFAGRLKINEILGGTSLLFSLYPILTCLLEQPFLIVLLAGSPASGAV